MIAHFVAEVRSKSGALLYRSPAYFTRKEAATDAFYTRANAKTCTTMKADADGNTAGNGIEDHNRVDIYPKPAKTAKATPATWPESMSARPSRRR